MYVCTHCAHSYHNTPFLLNDYFHLFFSLSLFLDSKKNFLEQKGNKNKKQKNSDKSRVLTPTLITQKEFFFCVCKIA